MPDQFRFAIYKFSNTLTEVQKATANLNQAKSTIDKMEMDVAGAGSNFPVACVIWPSWCGQRRWQDREFAEGHPAADDRWRGRQRERVFRMPECQRQRQEPEHLQLLGNWSKDSDFTVNEPGFWAGAERSQAIDVKVCDSFKSKGVTVATLNTEYITPAGSGDTRFQKIESILKPVIRQTMRNCASLPEYAYFATTPGEIQQATEMMFRSVLQKARLVQ